MNRVLIVDDHAAVRRSVRETIARALGDSEFGEADRAGEALRLVAAAPWDVVILDLSLPDRNGLETLREIRHLRPALPVLVMSMQPESQYGVVARSGGAVGYLAKGCPPDVLAASVRQALRAGAGPAPGEAPPATAPAAAGRSADELELCLRRAAAAHGDERRQIARALHDGVAQTLAALKLELGLALPDARDGRPHVAAAIAHADEAIAAIRRLGTAVRPPLLDELGLGAALRAWLEARGPEAARAGVRLALAGDEALPRGTPERESAAFEMVRAALDNVLRHAHGASAATVTLCAEAGRLTLSVRDDGVGFDPSRAGGPRQGRFGLAEIRVHARVLGGEVRVESAPGQGTALTVSLPLAEAS